MIATILISNQKQGKMRLFEGMVYRLDDRGRRFFLSYTYGGKWWVGYVNMIIMMQIEENIKEK